MFQSGSFITSTVISDRVACGKWSLRAYISVTICGSAEKFRGHALPYSLCTGCYEQQKCTHIFCEYTSSSGMLSPRRDIADISARILYYHGIGRRPEMCLVARLAGNDVTSSDARCLARSHLLIDRPVQRLYNLWASLPRCSDQLRWRVVCVCVCVCGGGVSVTTWCSCHQWLDAQRLRQELPAIHVLTGRHFCVISNNADHQGDRQETE